MHNHANLINFEQAFDYGWGIVKKHWVLLLQVFLLVYFINLPFNIIDEYWQGNSYFLTWTEIFLFIVFKLINWVVTYTLVFNSLKICLNILHGKQTTLADLFVLPTRQTLNFFATYFIYCVMIVAGLICFIIPGIYFALKYYFATIIVADKDLPILVAANKSAQMTEGLKWNLLGYFLVMFFVCLAMILVGLVFLIVGVIPASFIAMYIFTFANLEIYKKLSHEH